MDWQNFIRGLLVSTIVFGLILLGMTVFLSPEKGGVAIAVYYVSFSFFIAGFATIINFFVRRWWMHNEVVFGNIKNSIRQGSLFSIFVTLCLLLSSMRLLTWWDALIVVFSLLLVELYFKTRS